MTKLRWFVLAPSLLSLAGLAACATSAVITGGDASTTDDGGSGNDATTTTDSGPKPDGGCGAGETKCGSTCKNLKTDPDNCGQCATACSAGRACEQGECHLACAPQTRCIAGDAGDAGPELCVDTKTNAAHCGACNAACPSAQFCDGGACDLDCSDAGSKCNVPDSGLLCVDTQSSSAHCGACNQPCTGGKVCVGGTCTNAVPVQIFPPSGTLVDPGNASVWGGRYYTMTFAQQQTLGAVEWRANIATTDNFRAEVWDPGTQAKLATGSTVTGTGVLAYYKSTLTFLLQANKPYVIGVFMSNANTVFPRKNSPTYPFNVTGPYGNIAVSACWSTSGTTDVFPTSTNSWGPDFKITLQ